MANPIPVLPLVGSTTTLPDPRRPSRSAAVTMASARRSFTDPPGLKDSSLASRVTSHSAESRFSFTSGVRPTKQVMSLYIFIFSNKYRPI